MTRESQKKSKITPLKLVLILGLIVLGIIAGKYLILAVSPPSWTDSTITAGETLIRKVHVDELRTEINANRADVGLATTTWTDPTITAGETLIRAVHFTEARSAIEGIYNKILETPPTWTDATITPGETIIRKIHMDELRTEITDAYNLINAKKCCGSYGGVDTGSAGACPGTDDSACGTIDCSGWYIATGTEGVTETEYCYNKQDITVNRCEGIDDCKDANTTDCDPQATSTLKYECGDCKYIADGDCTGTTLGSCTNYAAGTSCGGIGYYCSEGECKHCYWKLTHAYEPCTWTCANGESLECNLSNAGVTGYEGGPYNGTRSCDPMDEYHKCSEAVYCACDWCGKADYLCICE